MCAQLHVLYQPSSLGLGLIQVHWGMIQGVIQNKTCNNIYMLYIHYICNIYWLVKYILFADDNNLFCADKNINQLVTTVSTVHDKLCIWFAVNKLSLNVSKTSHILQIW